VVKEFDMTVDEIVSKIETDMRKISGKNCEFEVRLWDRGKPDYFEIRFTVTCQHQCMYKKFKQFEGKWMIPFKYPDFVSRQDTIGLIKVEASDYLFESGDLLKKRGDFLLVFRFVEW
jgi:hypothetical protein